MTQQLRLAPPAQAAAFALLEALKGVDGPLAPASLLRLRYLGEVDPTARGLAVPADQGVTLAFELGAGSTRSTRPVWVHGGLEHGGPSLACFFERHRPALTLRFEGRSFEPDARGHWTLWERPVFPSSDPLHAHREAAATRLAQAWDIAVDGRRFRIGAWRADEGAWEPATARRFVAAAWLLNAARA